MNTIKLNTIGEAPIKKGGASGGGGGNYVYYRASADELGEFRGFLSVAKVRVDSSVIFFFPATYTVNNDVDILECGFDINLKISSFTGQGLITVGELIAEPSQSWTQITEEEFYNINI